MQHLNAFYWPLIKQMKLFSESERCRCLCHAVFSMLRNTIEKKIARRPKKNEIVYNGRWLRLSSSSNTAFSNFSSLLNPRDEKNDRIVKQITGGLEA